MQEFLNGLNIPQRKAVENTEGPSLVIAGAGSGKTRVLTLRIANLLTKGINPSKILALTFTNKAAREMKDRIACIVGQQIARYLWMGTFHSIFAKILRMEANYLSFPSNFTIYDTADSKSLLKTIIKNMQLDDKTYKPSGVLARISKAKNNLITSNAYLNSPQLMENDRASRMPKTGAIYAEYAKRCRQAGAMDFDDLLLYTNILFRDHPDILAKYQNKFDYILVDEYQDTNSSQYHIVNKLARQHKNICVVGDDAQSIYSFRGAKIENILNFRNDYPDYKTFKLEQNYRSTQNIVNAANSVIAKNEKQIPKIVFSNKEDGSKIKILSALTDNEEGYLVVNEILDLRLREQFAYKDYAILYRTNMQSRILEEALRKRNIPYKIYGGLSFYQRKEIKDLLSYFRMVINPLDNEAFKRIINYPARGIGATTVGKIEAAAIANNLSYWEVCQRTAINNPLKLNKGTLNKIIGFVNLIADFQKRAEEAEAFEIAVAVTKETGMMQELYRDKTPENLSRFENIQELLNGIKEFSLTAQEEGHPGKLPDFLEDVALLTDQDTEKEEDKNKITLMTIHSSKGLEFKNVFIVGLEENLFPSSHNGYLTPKELEEERRLFYVALTRAEQNVWLSFARQRYKYGKLDFAEPSRFLSEIDPKFLIMPPQSSGFFGDLSGPSDSDYVFKKREPTETSSGKPLSIPPRMGNRMRNLKNASGSQEDFKGAPPSKLKAGLIVDHQRFGRGKILSIEGEFPNQKATVQFENAGTRQLLLKFARLKIVN